MLLIHYINNVFSIFLCYVLLEKLKMYYTNRIDGVYNMWVRVEDNGEHRPHRNVFIIYSTIKNANTNRSCCYYYFKNDGIYRNLKLLGNTQ